MAPAAPATKIEAQSLHLAFTVGAHFKIRLCFIGPVNGPHMKENKMFGRVILRVVAVLLLVAVVIGVGTAVYNAGVTAGLTEAALQAAASGDPAPIIRDAYGYGWAGPYAHGPFGYGFGFFGIIFLILGIFLIFGLIRAAFGGRWGGPGLRGPGSWGGGRREMVEDWHREMHRREGSGGEQPASGA